MPLSKIKSSGIEGSSVDSASIVDGTVATVDIANGAVTSAKLDTNIDIAGTLDVTGATTLDDTLTVSGISTFQNNINVGSNTNLLSNSDFTTNTTGWTATDASLAIVSNELEITPNLSVNGYASQQVDNLVVGRSYIASITVTADASSFSRLYIGTTVTGSEVLSNLNLGVGTHSFGFVATATTHYFTLVVGGGTGQATRFDNARLYESSRITFPAASGTSPSIIQGNSVNDLAITTNNQNRLNVSSNGVVSIPQGIALGVGTSTTASNVLDDYEEGSFTPVIYGRTTAGSTSGTLGGTYTKIGNLVHCTIALANFTLSGAVGDLSISGFPFTSASSQAGGGFAIYIEGFNPAYYYSPDSDTNTLSFLMISGDTWGRFRPTITQSWDNYVNANTSTWTNGGGSTYGQMSVTYFTS